ncbi:MAG TPA: gluconate 2-dehydrogenase subunit 3 family protein [Bryobacteraceae bacterium]|jgi:hypothetical protein|nr:gluconate 2-dehydrogenase subunit 3 family protein [Bryobacteraceae bacterium]
MSNEPESGQTTRRGLMKRLATTATAAALPIVGQNPPPESRQNAMRVTDQAAAAYQYRYFGTHQLKTLAALTETIIPADEHSPGARDARVSEYIDAIVADAPSAKQKLWGDGLIMVNELARNGFAKAFEECSPEEQYATVAAMAGNEDDRSSPPQAFFLALKRATIDGYYTSKIGIHEDLQYQGNEALMDFPGCPHKENS